MAEGVAQCRRVGERFLKAYPSLLDNLSSEDTYVRSMWDPLARPALIRVLMSTEVLLDAVLPASPKTWARRFPIQVKKDGKEDPMNGPNCPLGQALSKRQDAMFQMPANLVSELGRIFGVQDFSKSAQGVDPAIADVSYTALCDGGELPCGPGGCVNASLFETLEKYFNEKWCTQYTGAEGGQVSSELLMYPLYKELVDRMNKKQVDRTNKTIKRPRFVLYQGRDLVVGPVAAALGFFDCLWPPFASHIAFELWEPQEGNNGDPKVRVLFDGKPVTEKVRGCGGKAFCPLADLREAIEGLLGGHQTHEEACNAESMLLPRQYPDGNDLAATSVPSALTSTTGLAFVATLAMLIVVLKLVASTSLFRHRRAPVNQFREPLLRG
jgi:hypothetical protein